MILQLLTTIFIIFCAFVFGGIMTTALLAEEGYLSKKAVYLIFDNKKEKPLK